MTEEKKLDSAAKEQTEATRIEISRKPRRIKKNALIKIVYDPKDRTLAALAKALRGVMSGREAGWMVYDVPMLIEDNLLETYCSKISVNSARNTPVKGCKSVIYCIEALRVKGEEWRTADEALGEKAPGEDGHFMNYIPYDDVTVYLGEEATARREI